MLRSGQQPTAVALALLVDAQLERGEQFGCILDFVEDHRPVAEAVEKSVGIGQGKGTLHRVVEADIVEIPTALMLEKGWLCFIFLGD